MTRIAHCHSFGPHKGRSHVLIASIILVRFLYLPEVQLVSLRTDVGLPSKCILHFSWIITQFWSIAMALTIFFWSFSFPFFLFLVFILPHLHSSPCSGDQAVLFVLWKLSIFAVCGLFVKLLVGTRVNSCPWCIRKAVADGQNWRRPCAFRL